MLAAYTYPFQETWTIHICPLPAIL